MNFLLKLSKKVNPHLLFAGGIIFFFSIVATIVRIIIIPDLDLILQARVHIISLLVFSVIVSFFFFINSILNKLYPYEKNVAIRILIQLVLGVTLIFILRTVLIAIAVNVIFIKIDRAVIVAVYMIDLFGCVAINCGFFAEYFFTQWKKTALQTERLQKEKAIVQYDSLKNQLNPHFLFNALASLNSLIYEDPDIASRFIKHLSKVYRYLLENKEVVSLQKELDFVQNYIFLLKTRFNGSFRIDVKIQEDDLKKHIVPVTIQNLLENAIKHNIVNSEFPLTIHILTDNGFLVVKNSINRKVLVENSNRQGLLNLKNLYHFLTKEEVLIKEDDDFFTVKIPLLPNSI